VGSGWVVFREPPAPRLLVLGLPPPPPGCPPPPPPPPLPHASRRSCPPARVTTARGRATQLRGSPLPCPDGGGVPAAPRRRHGRRGGRGRPPPRRRRRRGAAVRPASGVAAAATTAATGGGRGRRRRARRRGAAGAATAAAAPAVAAAAARGRRRWARGVRAGRPAAGAAGAVGWYGACRRRRRRRLLALAATAWARRPLRQRRPTRGGGGRCVASTFGTRAPATRHARARRTVRACPPYGARACARRAAWRGAAACTPRRRAGRWAVRAGDRCRGAPLRGGRVGGRVVPRARSPARDGGRGLCRHPVVCFFCAGASRRPRTDAGAARGHAGGRARGRSRCGRGGGRVEGAGPRACFRVRGEHHTMEARPDKRLSSPNRAAAPAARRGGTPQEREKKEGTVPDR